MSGEMLLEYKEYRVKELHFNNVQPKPVPPSICGYCMGKGYHETGEDTHECKICKGSGRNNG